MPSQHTARTGRARGSWLPRLAGIGVAVLLAGGGTVVYLMVGSRPAPHRPQLPSKVLSVQTVGIVAQLAAGQDRDRLLTSSADGLLFGAMPSSDLPQWTADAMAGGTYVFIYAPNGECLAAVSRRPGKGTGSQSSAPATPAQAVPAVLALRRCDLGPDQRWQQLSGDAASGGHHYRQYRNLGSARCLAMAGAATATGPDSTEQPAGAAVLAPCDPGLPTAQLISFWWAA